MRPAVTISATPATMTSDAPSVRASRLSPPTTRPTNSATTGFTNAYVPTRSGVETRSSHM